MSGNFAIKGGGVGRLMANAILNFHFDFLNPSLIRSQDQKTETRCLVFTTLELGASSIVLLQPAPVEDLAPPWLHLTFLIENNCYL